VLAAALAANAAPKAAASRGEVLYTTYCIGCHTAQVHWRDRKVVTTWSGLKAEVRRWQKTGGLSLEDDDIDAIAGYLNGLYYHFPEGDARRSGDAPAARLAATRRGD